MKQNKRPILRLVFAAILLAALAVRYVPEMRIKIDEHRTETAVQTMRTERQQMQAEAPPQDAARMFLVGLQQENPDTAAWISVPGTAIDYPVMYTPDDVEYYLHRDFAQNHSAPGLPFADAGGVSPAAADCLIVHGHNMRDGTMFTELLQYEAQSWCGEHPTVTLTLPEGTRTYEVFAVFHVYADDDAETGLYDCAGALTEEQHAALLADCAARSEYDTGVAAAPGDKVLLLSTCAYNAQGREQRFVVAARYAADVP